MRKRVSAQYLGNNPRRRIARILFLCALVLAILISILVLGNLLHERLEQSAPLLALPAISYKNIPEAVTAPAYAAFIPGDAQSGIYYAPDTGMLSDSKSLKESCAVAADLYDGLSVTLSDDTGLRFALNSTPEGGALYPQETLTALLEAADTASMPVCAVWQLSDSVPEWDSEDAQAIREFTGADFDEILFTTLTASSLSERDLAAVAALTDSLKEITPRTQVGFAMEYDAFTDADLAPMLEKLAMSVDFLAVDLGQAPEGEADSAAYARTRSAALYGSIAYYPLRVLIRGSAQSVAAQASALRENGVTAVQPIG